MALSACKPSTETVEDQLKERYGKEFCSQGLIEVEGGYNSVCYPEDNPKQLFEASFKENGEVYYDDYVGAMIADHEAELFSQEIEGNDILYVHGYRYGRLSVNRLESFNNIALHIRQNKFQYEEYFESLKSETGKDFVTYSSLYIFMKSDDNPDEYDRFEKASNIIISEYKERYDLDIWVQVTVIFVDDPNYYDKAEQYYMKHADINSFQEDELKGWTDNRIVMGFGDSKYIPESLYISKEEYTKKLEEMN